MQESTGKEDDGVKTQGKRMTDSCGYRDGAWLVVAGSRGRVTGTEADRR